MESTGTNGNGTVAEPRLRRDVGPGLLLFVSLGNMLGAGIYALVGEIGAEVGGAMWASFLLALTLAVFTAGAYAELATKYPRAGGAATYVNRAFKNAFVSFMVTFALVASAVNSAAALAIATGGYLRELIPIPIVLSALVLVILVGLINLRGVAQSVKVNAGITVIEALGLLLIVFIGFAALLSGSGEPGRAFEFNEGTSVPLAILAGTSLAFYAFIGFEDAVNMAEETRNPSRVYPAVLFGSLLVAGVLYLLVSFTASMVVSVERMAGSSGPLLEVVEAGPLPVPTGVFALIALLAVANGALLNVLTASRMIYGMAGQGILPEPFARVHRFRHTPWVAIIFATVFAAVLVFTGELGILADTTVVLLLAVFAAVNVSALILRRDSVEHSHFRAPTVFPVLGIAVSIVLLVQQDAGVFLRVLVLLLVGVGLWLLNAPFMQRQATRKRDDQRVR